MAGVTGLEPAASGVTGRRSNRLSYTPLRAATRSQRRSLPACTGSDSASQGEHEGCSGPARALHDPRTPPRQAV